MASLPVFRHLGVRKQGNVTVVRFGDHRILNEAAIDVIGDELYGVAEQSDCRRLLLDFAGVDRVSSSMLGKLLMVKRRMDSKGGKLKLCNLDPEVLEAFRSTNLDHILDIRDSELDALKAFG